MTTAKIKNEPVVPWREDLDDCPTINLGTTLRDYFAAKAMQGLVAARDRPSGSAIVEYAYHMADGMLEERARNANANVIAAAPELYAALHRLLDVVYDTKGGDLEREIQNALAVMEKARGAEDE